MTESREFSVGQRVRINQQEDPPIHVGKMAIVEELRIGDDGEPICMLKIDRVTGPAIFPERFLEPVITQPSTLLANDLFLPFDMDSPEPRFKAYTEDRDLAGQVLERLLYYDRLFVPTVDYSIIVPLVQWLGVSVLRDMLVSEAISFVHFQGSLGYGGGGQGLVLFEIHPGEKTELWWQKASRCSPEEATVLQLQNRPIGLNNTDIQTLGKLVEICTVDTAFPDFTQKVEEETYRDILDSDLLTTYFSIRNTNLKNLEALAPNQFRVFSSLVKPATAGSEIDITLRLAMLNLEAYLAEEAGARDMVTDRGFGRLLDAKVERMTRGSVAL